MKIIEKPTDRSPVELSSTGKLRVTSCAFERQMVAGLKNTFLEKNKGFDENEFNPALPPWGSAASWFEANQSLDHLIRCNRDKLGGAMELARRIQVDLESIFGLMEHLCSFTCLFCPDPCCLAAKVWIDFRDLLFLHLSKQQIPDGQILRNLKQTCRYWSFRGCTLSRILRPWVCTWYLCPAQAANFRRKPLAVQKNFNRMVQAVKNRRKQMEAEFINAIF